MRGIQRTFGVARQTLASWLREAAAVLPDSPPVAPAEASDVLELDEVCPLSAQKKRTLALDSLLSAHLPSRRLL